MKIPRLLTWLMLPAVLAMATPLPAQVDSKTPPTFLTVGTKPLRDAEATYNFEVTISASRTAEGIQQLQVVTTIIKVSGDQTARFREIRQTISPDASGFSIMADGKEFVLEAQYVEQSEDKTVPPRYVPTTYGVMFGGGRVGITVRRTN